MIVAGQRLPILIATRPVDFRCGHQALALIVQNVLKLEPYSGVTVIFRSKRGDRLKALAWDGTGLVLVYKVLEVSGFAWPAIQDGVMTLSRAQAEALFEVLDWRKRDGTAGSASCCGGMTRRAYSCSGTWSPAAVLRMNWHVFVLRHQPLS